MKRTGAVVQHTRRQRVSDRRLKPMRRIAQAERMILVQNLVTCLNILLPIFAVVALGFFLQAKQIITDGFIMVGSHILFYVVLPCSLFMNLYGSDFSDIFNPKLVLFVVAAHLAFVLACALILPVFFRDRGQCGIVVQGAFRGNVLLLGLPLAANMYGASGMAPTALVMAYIIPLYNILGVITLSVFSGGDKQRVQWKDLCWKIIKNPLVLGTLAALPFVIFQIHLPGVVTETISDVGGIGSVFGLLLLGAQIRLPSLRRNAAPIVVATVLKLAGLPLLMMGAAILIGFNNAELGSVFILSAAPASVTSFIMASTMGDDGELAGQIVFVSTIFSTFTLLGGLYALTLLGIL